MQKRLNVFLICLQISRIRLTIWANRLNIFIPLQNTRIRLTLSTNRFNAFLNHLQKFSVRLMVWTKRLNGFLVRLIETWLIFRLKMKQSFNLGECKSRN